MQREKLVPSLSKPHNPRHICHATDHLNFRPLCSIRSFYGDFDISQPHPVMCLGYGFQSAHPLYNHVLLGMFYPRWLVIRCTPIVTIVVFVPWFFFFPSFFSHRLLDMVLYGTFYIGGWYLEFAQYILSGHVLLVYRLDFNILIDVLYLA